MDIIDAIKSRRSIGKVKEDMIPKNIIEKIIETGTYAPNRYLTQPWRFTVITGEGRHKLSAVMEGIVLESNLDLNTVEGQKKLQKEKNKPLRAPVIIAVANKFIEHKKALPIEEIGATYAAIENMLLAAHSLGIASIWKTGNACYSPLLREFLNLDEKDMVLGLIYLGYPDTTKLPAARTSIDALTTWID